MSNSIGSSSKLSLQTFISGYRQKCDDNGTKIQKIANRFASKEDLIETDNQGLANEIKSFEKTGIDWKIDIPITVTGFSKDKNERVEELRTVRLQITSELDKPYPQSHQIVIMDIVEDIFFHWTFNCNPFTFKSLAKRMNWILPQVAGDQFYETFKRFGYLIRECSKNVAMDPARYSAQFCVSPDKEIGTLLFNEIINEYRCVELISIDFIPTEWDKIKHDVLQYTGSVQQEHQQTKLKLVKIMNTITEHQPALLLYLDNVYDPVSALPTYSWLKAKERMSQSNSNTFESHHQRAAQFIADLSLEEFENEGVANKTLTLPIHDLTNDTFSSRQLSFNYYYRRLEQGNSAYVIEVVDSLDPFFCFISVPITPEKFQDMTFQIHTVPREDVTKIGQVLGSSKTAFTHAGSLNETKLSRNLGYYDPSGARGVVGVIAEDYMAGAIESPERAKFEIDYANSQGKTSAHKVLDRSNHKPIELVAKLVICEHVLYQERSRIEVEFRSAPLAKLQWQIQKKYREGKHQISACKSKIETILRTVRSQNISLYSLLEKPSKNLKKLEPNLNLYNATTQYGYDSTWHEKKPKFTLSRIESSDPDIIAPRSVVKMKIPVSIPSSTHAYKPGYNALKNSNLKPKLQGNKHESIPK